ncbi:MAG: nitrate/sulfonate/bicarbonate ABC transporter ATP-binding protein [Legionellales bacterium]|nr:nitrate/sulfonate/bicarbonate ABC transporter ATP-binding protein [Legionellales bacterium]
MHKDIITIKNVKKSFKKSGNQELLVLDNIKFSLRENEIVALLGKSGSGKSTLLRIIAGLIFPDAGEAFYRGKSIEKPVEGISMVFQHFALMPWLTVLQNVELGLEALGVNRRERRQRALQAIDTIGLDGFESAYPKELSGGMRQRVGIARAIVVNPDLLLMDEPFSALDVLTAENLRSDLLDLWQSKKTNTNGILIVTHNIEEAVALADRIFIFGSDPGYIREKIIVDIPHPRNDDSPEFRQLVDDIYTAMTTRRDESPQQRTQRLRKIDLSFRLPDVQVSELTGVLETLDTPEYQGRMDLPELADYAQKDIDDLVPLTDMLVILDFAQVKDGDIQLLAKGREFANADILVRKQIFKTQLLKYIPLAQHICQLLDEKSTHRLSEDFFLDQLEDYFSEEEAERILRTMIDWGRYAEIFAYDYNDGMLSLENPN